MKSFYVLLSALAICLFSSFNKLSEACQYAGSNITYVKNQTELAMDADDINKARFHTYKAIKGIYRSQEQLKECGCQLAAAAIEESEDHLKLATKSTSISGTKILLAEALEKTMASLEALEKHHLHDQTDLRLEMARDAETLENNMVTIELEKSENQVLHDLIDNSLIAYEASIEKVVNTVSCKEARAFADLIFNNCEQELLKPGLSEGKKYYNLRTKEITSRAIERLGTCDGTAAK